MRNRHIEPATVFVDPREWKRRVLSEINRNQYHGDPVSWFGQEAIMDQVSPFLNHEDPFPHTILLGEPGLGKTHLARYIAFTRSEQFEELLAPQKPENMPRKGIVLLDEVHRQKSPEPLFKLMMGDIPTIMAATTRPDLVDKAFRSRFFLELHLRPYSAKAMAELIRSELEAPEETVDILSTAAAGNPRQAKQLTEVAKRLRTTDPESILASCRITADGLTDMHINYLETLQRMNRSTGLSQLANVLYADETTVKSTERLLIEKGLVELRSTGRDITRAGIDYLKALDGT